MDRSNSSAVKVPVTAMNLLASGSSELHVRSVAKYPFYKGGCDIVKRWRNLHERRVGCTLSYSFFVANLLNQ